MRVRSISIQTFRSIYDVTVQLDQLTVFTGPNGAGKSNLVSAMHFLGEVYQYGLEIAVSRAGGYENLVHRRSRPAKHPVRFSIEVTLSGEDLNQLRRFYTSSRAKKFRENLEIKVLHTFSFKTSSESTLSDFNILQDRISIETSDGVELLVLEREEDGKVDIEVDQGAVKAIPGFETLLGFLSDETYRDRALNSRPLQSTELMSDRRFLTEVISEVTEKLSSISYFQLSPFQCRQTGVSTPNAYLDQYGGNLPGALSHLKKSDKSAWSSIIDAMRSINPRLLDIEVVRSEDRRLALRFKESGIGRAWSANEVSDGTIQSLALYVALYDKRSPVLIVEEPENAVHPWILKDFLDKCTEAPQKQIVLTTHSPVVINYVDVSSLRLLFVKEGRTKIVPFIDADPFMRELLTVGNSTAFELYDSGLVSEVVPEGMSYVEMDPEIENL